MVLLGCFVAQKRGIMFAKTGDNVVFVREPCNLFDPSCVKVGLSQTGVYTFLGVFRGQNRVYYISVMDSARKSSEIHVFLRIMQLLRNICDITMNQSYCRVNERRKNGREKPALSQIRFTFHASFTIHFAR